ncbi:MAG: NAD(P)-binding domain-containing protein, partial [Candidatus Binatia bacterium]
MVREIGVVGAGGWGTALAKVLADKGERVALWCHGRECYRDVAERRENRAYLPGIELPVNIEATQSLTTAVVHKRLVICAVPSHAVRAVFAQASDKIKPETLLLCGTK